MRLNFKAKMDDQALKDFKKGEDELEGILPRWPILSFADFSCPVLLIFEMSIFLLIFAIIYICCFFNVPFFADFLRILIFADFLLNSIVSSFADFLISSFDGYLSSVLLHFYEYQYLLNF
jgi:hypothetical protein